MMKYKSILASLCAALTLQLTACGGGEDGSLKGFVANPIGDAPSAGPVHEEQAPTVQNGYLVFKSQAQFDALLNSVSAMNKSERNAALNQFVGFQSMENIYTSIMNDANNYLEGIERSGRSGAELEINNYFSALANQHASIVHVARLGDGALLERNITNDSLAALLNHQGIVQVGSNVYQYAHDKTRSSIRAGTKLPSASWQLSQDGLAKTLVRRECAIDEVNCPENVRDVPSEPREPVIIAPSSKVREGQSMVFSVNVDPSMDGRPVWYPFVLGNAADTADRSDTGVISFSDGVQNISEGRIAVPANVVNFSISISISNDGKPENQETLSIKVGDASATGIIESSSDNYCEVYCQNFEHSRDIVEDNKPKNRLIVYENMMQVMSDNKVKTFHTIKLRSLKKRLLSAWWIDDNSNMAVAGSLNGNKVRNFSFYGDNINTLTGVIMNQIDDAWDIPRINTATIRAVRTGGPDGLEAWIQY